MSVAILQLYIAPGHSGANSHEDHVQTESTLGTSQGIPRIRLDNGTGNPSLVCSYSRFPHERRAFHHPPITSMMEPSRWETVPLVTLF